jgi:hypothetical protein
LLLIIDVFGTSTKGKQRHVSEVLSSSKADVDATESLLLFGLVEKQNISYVLNRMESLQ